MGGMSRASSEGETGMAYERRTIICEKAAKAWDDAYRYRPEPSVIEIPLISYVLMATVGVAQFVALMLLWPNP